MTFVQPADLRRRCPPCQADDHGYCNQIDGNAGAVDALDFTDYGCRCECLEVEAVNEDPQSVLILTQAEWDLLADICRWWRLEAEDGHLRWDTPAHEELAYRIIEASE